MPENKEVSPLTIEEPTPAVNYTDDEIKYRDKVIKNLESAKNQRNASWAELNDMSLVTYYESNAKAANSYIRPKDNKDDTRIVTGTTEEKGTTLLSSLLNYNLAPTFTAFDLKDDSEIQGVGTVIESLVKKSREIEDYDDQRPLIYKEMLDQGDVWVEEQWIETYKLEKEKVDMEKAIHPSKMKEIKGKWEKDYEGCKARLISGLSVFQGNLKNFFVQEQPFLATVEIMTYDEARAIYGQWERWENVPRKVLNLSSNDSSKAVKYQNWTLLQVETDMVEVLKYYNKPANEFQLYLNGVQILPVGFPLTSISPSGDYPLAKGSAAPISRWFAVSKSIPAKTKVDQQVFDEMYKQLILAFQQARKPPMANNTKRALSKNLWTPGTVHRDIDPTKLQPIFTPVPVSAAEFNTVEFVKRIIDEKSVSPAFSGDMTQGGVTATQVIEMKKQQMMKLGSVIAGVISLERQLSWLRAKNILAHWTQEIDTRIDETTNRIQKIYRSITVEDNLENGMKGNRMIEFNPELANTLSPEQVMAEEDFLSEGGKPIRKHYVDPEVLANLKARWFITVVPTEKETSDLQRVLFVQNIRDAVALFGPQALNQEYMKERFAILIKEDPNKMFVKGQAPMMGADGEGGGALAAQMTAGTKAPAQPSLNTMMKQ